MQQLQLHLVGLDGRDFRTYKTLLRLGPSSIRSLASASNINRGSTYESLKKLSACGLVSFQQYTAKTKRYVAEEPDRLSALIEERKLELQLLDAQIKPHLRVLEKAYDTGFSLPTRLYEGDEGVAAILRDVLVTMSKQSNKSYRAISSQTVSNHMYRRFANFTKKRIEDGIAVRVLSADSGEKAKLSERRHLSTATYEVEAYIILYSSKTAIISITDLNIPHGLVIDDPAITNTQKALFELLWQSAK